MTEVWPWGKLLTTSTKLAANNTSNLIDIVLNISDDCVIIALDILLKEGYVRGRKKAGYDF